MRAPPAVSAAPPAQHCLSGGAEAPDGTGGAGGRGQRLGHPVLAGMRSLPGSASHHFIRGESRRMKTQRFGFDQFQRSRENQSHQSIMARFFGGG